MKRLVQLLALVCILAMTATAAFAQTEPPTRVEPQTPAPSAETGLATHEGFSAWFIEFKSKPSSAGGGVTAMRSERNAFRAQAARMGINYKERYSFTTLWNGISVETDAAGLSMLSQMSGVTGIYPVHAIPIPESTPDLSPELFTAITQTGADIVHSELGYTGKGIKVAVMDTGIDYDHPYLGGSGTDGATPFPTARVIKGWDFVGDDYNADPSSEFYQPIPHPDPDPDDCNGHGTHVAGIVGANGEDFVGVAPDVTFGAYRVFGCEGSTTDEIMIAAMERVYKDKMQVLNMSIGDPYTWPQAPTAKASDRLVEAGVVVVASIGNNGANGLYSAGAPGLGKKVIGVASFDNINVALNFFTVSPDNAKIGYAPATGAPLPPTSGTYPMARTGTAASTADACTELPAGSLTGQVALIRRGGCTFYTKSFNAQTAGAIAVVLYNNANGRFSPTVAGTPEITIPVVAISRAEGELIDSRLAAGPVDMTWTAETGSFENPTGNLISSFSSFGLAPDLSIKPDLGAPGGLIYSTYPLEEGGFANISGTSMASPHVAGAVALFLQARPIAKPANVKTVFQNTAEPKDWWGFPGVGYIDNVNRQGAGMLKIDRAILTKQGVEPSAIATGESEAGPYQTRLKITNIEKVPVTYDLSYVNALSVVGTFAPDYWEGDAVVTFSQDSITVPAKGSKYVNVTITPATEPDQAQYGGYIVFTPVDGGTLLRVPYAGFVGDYQSIVAMAPTEYEFPWVSRFTDCFRFVGNECQGGGTVEQTPPDYVFTLTDPYNMPNFAVHFDHQVTKMVIKVMNVAVGNWLWLPVYTANYLPRNETSTGFFAYPWDGTVTVGGKTYPVPDGTYIAQIKVLKALGNPSNPDDWETWTSPEIIIDRP